MKSNELAELLLAALHDLAQSKGHGQYYSLTEIAAEFGEKDRGRVGEIGQWLEEQGLAQVIIDTGGTAARIVARGNLLVEEGGRTGIIEKYRHGMHTPSAFPPYPGPNIKREDVVNYLLRCKAGGWCQEVYQGDGPNEFIILADNDRKILLRGEPRGYVVVAEYLGTQETVGLAETFGGLEQLVSTAGNLHGGQWPSKVTSARLSVSTPASNLATISTLAGTSEIQAVFDPYLSNKSLAALLDILTLGPSLSNSVRLLACAKMTAGTKPQLTKSFVDLWFQERGVTGGEARRMPDGEQRRFLLLSGGQSLILGMSLNGIAKNEAVRLEPDADDRTFFDSVWMAATPL
jgi:hypothetical protein